MSAPIGETLAKRSAVPARDCRPVSGHNGAAARSGTGSPESGARPTKTRRDRRGGPAAGSRPQGAIMGGRGTATRGSPQIPPARVPDPPRIAPGAGPASPRALPDPPGAGPCPGAPREAHDKSLSSQPRYARLYRLGGAPIGGDARDRAPGPALRSAPCRCPRASALASPCCGRSLPEPGLIWSRWRQAVGTAQPPQPACQYPAHYPPAARPRSHAHRARPLPPRDPLQIPGPRGPCFRLCGPCLAASQVPKPVFIFGNVLEHDHRAHSIFPQTPFNGPTITDPSDLQALQVAYVPNWVTC